MSGRHVGRFTVVIWHFSVSARMLDWCPLIDFVLYVLIELDTLYDRLE